MRRDVVRVQRRGAQPLLGVAQSERPYERLARFCFDPLAHDLRDKRGTPAGDRIDLEIELLDVAHRTRVRVEHLHRAAFGIQTVGEWFANRKDTTAGSRSRLGHSYVVTLRDELRRDAESRHSCAQYEDSLSVRRANATRLVCTREEIGRAYRQNCRSRRCMPEEGPAIDVRHFVPLANAVTERNAEHLGTPNPPVGGAAIPPRTPTR